MHNTRRVRYNGMCLPKSVNASVLDLKKLSRRVKLEIDRHPFPVKRDVLSSTWLDINKVLQRMRQLESDHIKIEKYETNVGRKKYQKSLIAQNKVKDETVFISGKKLADRHGASIAKGDVWKHPLYRDKYSYIVESIGKVGCFEEDEIYKHTAKLENTYIVTLREKRLDGDKLRKDRIISLPIANLIAGFYLHDVSFFDTDYTPNYCENCDTYHESWANDGGFKLND